MSHAKTIAERILARDAGVMDRQCSLEDLIRADMDDLDHWGFVMDVEDEFDLELTDAEVEAAKTFADLARLVARRAPHLITPADAEALGLAPAG